VQRVFFRTSDAFVLLRGWERASHPGLRWHHVLSTVQSISFRTLRAGDRKKMRNGEGEVKPILTHAPGPGPASPQKSRLSLREYNALLEPSCLLSNRPFAEHACLLVSCGAADHLSDAQPTAKMPHGRLRPS
jgi:hypothetical protein